MSKRKGFKLFGNRRLSLSWLFGILGACCLLSYGFAALTGTLPTETPEPKDITATHEVGLQRTQVAVAYLTATVETWTPAPTETFTPTMTLSPTNTSTPTTTAIPSSTPLRTPTIEPTATQQPQTRFIMTEQVNVRECPGVECDVLGQFNYGDSFVTTDQGADPEGYTWYGFQAFGTTAWVAGGLTSTEEPTQVDTRSSRTDNKVMVSASASVNLRTGPSVAYPVAGTLTSGQTLEGVARNSAGDWVVLTTGAWVATWVVSVEGNVASLPTRSVAPPPVIQQPAAQPAAPVQQPAAAPSWNCSGNIYDCGEFSSCTEMWSYWNACLGDPSNLDGDGDGRPCEGRCG